MELVKVGTKIKFTQEDRDALKEVRDIIGKIWNEMRESGYIMGYSEDDVSDIYYMLESITEADDDELVIKDEF